MIPLVRPTYPLLKDIEHYFTRSKSLRKYTNFGPCFDEAVKQLNKKLNKFVLPVTNGTAAIQIALQTKLPRGSTVLLPDFTHIGTLNAVISAGMHPVLGSVDKSTWTLSRKSLSNLGDYDAFIVVSPFGYKVDFDFYDAFSKQNSRPVIYDLAGAWGMDVKTDNPFTFSLHATKNFSMGEGGLVCFNSHSDWIIGQRLLNFDTQLDRTIASPYGSNLKMDEIRCAALLANLEINFVIEKKAKSKQGHISYYQSELGSLCIEHDRHLGNAAPSMCVLAGLPAEELEQWGARNGIEMKRYYLLLSEMEGLQSISTINRSSQFFKTTCALPSDINENEAIKVVDSIRKFMGDKTRIR